MQHLASMWSARALGLCLLVTAAQGSDGGASGVAVDVRARALAPGEPVRIDVLSTTALTELRGRFLDQPFPLARVEATANGERWTGWTMIDLDRAPGPANVEITGRAADGGAVRASHAVEIAAKEFPVERLQVASKYVEPPADVQERLVREQERLARVYGRRDPLTAAGAPFVRPVPGEATSTFGKRRVFNGQARSPHPGLDLRAAQGTPVRVAGSGIVALAEDLYYSGNTVIVDHGGGLFTIYAHLSSMAVREGQALDAGARVGLSGATGRVTGPHLHWGAKIGDRPFDPTALLDPALFP